MSNRLIHSDSPYLQQHAHNPVDWFPWGDEAFEKAKSEQKPIFLSIGYSSCHWCHVMEREVFENEALAEKLNRDFVSIKVDREERPDIDKHFQDVHYLLNRRPGGWPTSIFLTPEKKPFFAATYIPPEPRHGIIGFGNLLDVVVDRFGGKGREEIETAADEIVKALGKQNARTFPGLDANLGSRALAQARKHYDEVHGGFSAAPKFPHTSTINLLLVLARTEKSDEAAKMALHSLREMAKGGLRDLVDGGFCRYSVDDEWLVPHFEKMTYDNALLIESYVRAYRHSGDERFLAIARETADFMLERMWEEGLFYSASDADTDGEEGKYFVYSYKEAKEAGIDEAVLKYLGFSRIGNFEGKTIVRFQEGDAPEGTAEALKILAKLREPRTYPFIDRKVITSLNAMMAKALFLLGQEDEAYLTPAKKSLVALLETMAPDGKPAHSALHGKAPTVAGFLEDYAYLADALLAAHQATLEEHWLVMAQKIANEGLAAFYERGKWYFSRGEFETLGDGQDASYPSAVGVMADALLTLGLLVEPKYREFARQTLEYYAFETSNHPAFCAALARAGLRVITGDVTATLGSGLPADVRKTLEGSGHPFLFYRKGPESGVELCGPEGCFAKSDDPSESVAALAKLF